MPPHAHDLPAPDSGLDRFAPPSLRRALRAAGAHPAVEVFDAALLFADVSGFTALAARMAARGLGAAEELSVHLNACFGETLRLPPYKFNKLEIRSFPLLADPAKLQKLVDQLNIAPPEVCEFRAVGNVAFMQLAVYPYLESEPDPSGWFTENELSFNLLVACGKRVDGVFVPNALAYYFPFIYVDNDWAIATGREVFGYPKIASEMHFGAAGETEIFSLQTLALPVQGADEQARIVKLVEIVETEQLDGWRKIVAEVEGVVSEFSDLIFGPNGIVADASLGLLESFASTFGKQQIGIVSLKQFRDAADPSRACYQALVSTQFKIDTWHQCAPMPGKFAARILREASMPIIESLGLTVGADGLVATLQPFVMQYDCTVTVGTNLYVA